MGEGGPGATARSRRVRADRDAEPQRNEPLCLGLRRRSARASQPDGRDSAGAHAPAYRDGRVAGADPAEEVIAVLRASVSLWWVLRMLVEPVTLEGNHVWPEPLSLEHLDALTAVGL